MKKLENNKGIALASIVIIVVLVLILSMILISTLSGKSENVEKPENTTNQTVENGQNNTNNTVAEHNHNYELFIERQSEASCAEKSKVKFACSICGETTVKEDGELLPHELDNGTVTKEPTEKINGIKEYKCINCGRVEIEEIPKIVTTYLVDTVEIGDYVDIGIDYINQSTPNTLYLSKNDISTTGWRVLSKSGKGEDGIVKLVSAGVPLIFNHTSVNDSEKSAQYLTNLNQSIQLVSETQQGYTQNGFSNNNLTSVWANCDKINKSAGVHSITTEEISQAYFDITGDKKTIRELEALNNSFITSNMITVNKDMSKKAYDLLGNGMFYWINGTRSTYYDNLYCLTNECVIDSTFTGNFGVRPVVTLNAGIQISSTNAGDGSSVSLAYILK